LLTSLFDTRPNVVWNLVFPNTEKRFPKSLVRQRDMLHAINKALTMRSKEGLQWPRGKACQLVIRFGSEKQFHDKTPSSFGVLPNYVIYAVNCP